MRMLTTRASLVVCLLLAFSLISTCLQCPDEPRICAFDIRSFGTTKVANQDVLDILVKVSDRFIYLGAVLTLCSYVWSIAYQSFVTW